MSFFSPLKAGLHIGKDYLSFVILKPTRGGFEIKDAEVIPLSKNAVRHSPIEPNILNMDEIKGHLKKLFTNYPNLKSVSLSLPDLSSRMILIEIKNGIPSLNELNQMFKWNMEQKFITEIGDCRFSHQLISQSDQSFKNPAEVNGSKKYFYILGTAILKNILSEYESLPVSLNVIPKVMNNASFHLFNLYHDLILKQAEPGDFLFLNIIDQYFTIMVFEKKLLRYVRTIGLRSSQDGPEEEKKEIDHKNQSKMFQEVETSLQFHFKEVFSKSDIHLFITGPLETPLFALQAKEQFKMPVFLLKPEMLAGLEEIAQTRDNEEISQLSPAIAAAVGALN